MKRGFTLIELLIVVGLIGMIFAATAVNYSKYNRKKSVQEKASDLITNLRHAQSKALAGEKPSLCSEYLESLELQFTNSRDYKIIANCQGEIDIKTGLSLGDNVIKVSGPDEIKFKLLGHGVIYPGTIRLSGFSGQWLYDISVEESGEITDQGFQ